LRGLCAPAPGYPADMTAAAITFVRQSRGTEVTVHDRGWHQARRVSRHTGIAESTAAGR